MKTSKAFKHAFNMVLHSKLRSWLTILGIVIGVGAVIAIMSLGQGLQQTMNNQLGDLGGDILTLSAGFSRSDGFGMHGPGDRGGGSNSRATEEEVVIDRSDVQTLRGIPDIALIDTNIRGSVDVEYMGESGTASLTGVNQKVWSDITTLKIAQGRMLDSADQNVIVIGGRLANSYFDRELGLNKMLTIDGSSYRVVGILDDSSTSIYMPLQTSYHLLDDKTTDIYDSVVIKVKDEDNLNNTIDKINNKLMTKRHVTTNDKDFTISSRAEAQAMRISMMSSMNMFLLALAAVSLIVGAIGIANTMFTSVLEKTKEIGIMKAIGARNKDIMVMFLLNSMLIGLAGGLLGVVFGVFLSGTMTSLMGNTPLSRFGSVVSTNSIIIALSVSVIVGIASGIIPAYKASKLKPVDALRYE